MGKVAFDVKIPTYPTMSCGGPRSKSQCPSSQGTQPGRGGGHGNKQSSVHTSVTAETGPQHPQCRENLQEDEAGAEF